MTASPNLKAASLLKFTLPVFPLRQGRYPMAVLVFLALLHTRRHRVVRGGAFFQEVLEELQVFGASDNVLA